MNRMLKISYLILLTAIILPACTAYKKVSYLKDSNNEKIAETKIAESKIFPNDLLTIVVNTNTPEASMAFNMPLTPTNIINNTSVISTIGLQTYLVESDGTINFPILGKLSIAGITKKEVEKLIKDKIYPKYITEEPIVNIHFVNYKISVLGEVVKPGSYTISNERVSVFDALALAGDMTVYGKRNNVLLLRENLHGEKETVRLDLQSKNIISSPYFYLQQNDVIYVEPNKHKANSSSIGSTETLSISVTSTLISLTSLLITVFK